ncbi:methyltransferase domain-containing protein [Methylophilales bacterium]|nr:methyltransferase domain-containing protein [Methylophilales bacterium]
MNTDQITKLYYTIVPLRFIRFHAYRVERFIKKMAQEYDFKGNKILDIGAGSTYHSGHFSKAKYLSQDIIQNSYNTIDYVYDICSKDEILDSEAVNVILCAQVLEHLTAPQSALDEMFRVLKPGGKVYLTTHMAFEEHMLPHDYWRFTEFGMRLLAKNSKFEVIHFERHGATANLIHYAFWTWPIRTLFKNRSNVIYYLYAILSTPFILITGILSEFIDYISKDNGIYTNFEIILKKRE